MTYRSSNYGIISSLECEFYVLLYIQYPLEFIGLDLKMSTICIPAVNNPNLTKKTYNIHVLPTIPD